MGKLGQFGQFGQFGPAHCPQVEVLAAGDGSSGSAPDLPPPNEDASMSPEGTPEKRPRKKLRAADVTPTLLEFGGEAHLETVESSPPSTVPATMAELAEMYGPEVERGTQFRFISDIMRLEMSTFVFPVSVVRQSRAKPIEARDTRSIELALDQLILHLALRAIAHATAVATMSRWNMRWRSRRKLERRLMRRSRRDLRTILRWRKTESTSNYTFLGGGKKQNHFPNA